MMKEAPLSGVRVLVVEDNYLVAKLIASVLGAQGAEVIGPVGNIAEAQAAALERPPRVAVLDFDIKGEPVTPLADALADRGVPCVFITGFGDSLRLPERHADAPCVAKPFEPATLLAVVARTVGGAAPGNDAARN